MNLTEKIVRRFVVGLPSSAQVRAGQFVAVKPHRVMTHDNTAAVMAKFKALKLKEFAQPSQAVFTLDHNVQDHSEENRKKYNAIKAFAKKNQVDFYPAGRGIGHQIMVEEGYAWPGTLVVASDSHSNMYGGLGCLGTPVVRTDAAAIWATGQTWWQVPPVARVFLDGKLQPGVSGKDIITTLCSHFGNDEVLNHAVEFTGPGVSTLSIDQRLTIANMTTEWGALTGLFPVDSTTVQWIRQRLAYIQGRGPAGVVSDGNIEGFEAGQYSHPRFNEAAVAELQHEVHSKELAADDDASYALSLSLDLGTVSPHVSGPNHVKVGTSVAELEQQNIKIDKAYIVSCVNSRVSDLEEAASILTGRKVADHVELYIAPASSEVQIQCEQLGIWNQMLLAGAKPLPAGCGPCIGMGAGLLQAGEVGISATNRNFRGRMGHVDSKAYLASPAVVAASAVAGKISSVGSVLGSGAPTQASSVVASRQSPQPLAETKKAETSLLDGFPTTLQGNIVFCDANDLNTDGIYAGKHTYRELTEEDMAAVALENYDEKSFAPTSQGGLGLGYPTDAGTPLLVSGFNFGTGSSREQAATCLKLRGFPCVIAGSYSATYVRNAFNNGFLALESPDFVRFLRENINPEKVPTVVSPEQAVIDFANSRISFMEKLFDLSPVGPAAQELIIAGGLENWVRNRLNLSSPKSAAAPKPKAKKTKKAKKTNKSTK